MRHRVLSEENPEAKRTELWVRGLFLGALTWPS